NETASVEANITIPMGISADTVDLLTFRATSDNEPTLTRQIVVNTTVETAFVIELDIEGLTSWTSGVNPPNSANVTLTLRNYGNDNVTITVKYLTSTTGWDITFPRFLDGKVFVEKADTTTEGIETVNITITAPSSAQPDDEITLTVWGEKTDLPEAWYSWQYKENLSIRIVVNPIFGVILTPGRTEGFATSGDTIYTFTMKNIGNEDIIIDLIKDLDAELVANLDLSQVTLRVGAVPVGNSLKVSTAPNSPQGNYTINISARDNTTGDLVEYMHLYYIIVPSLNITNISISEPEPLQHKTLTLSVTIENIGYIDARNITIKLFDGSKKVGEKHLDYINSGEQNTTNIKWAPSDFGNRSIWVKIDVEGVGDFSSFGTNIAEESIGVEVKINWQPFYLAIYVVIVIILGLAVLASILQLRFYGGRPSLDHYGETEEDIDYEDYPEEEELFPKEAEKEVEGPFATIGMTPGREEREEERPFYERPKEKPMGIPERRKEPIEREIAPSKDPETMRKENELRDEISRVQDKLDKTKSLGVDTTNLYQLLKTAKRSLNEGNHNKTKQYLGYANERLESLIAKRDEAIQAIKEAKEILSGMRGTTDLTIVENFLVKADSLLAEGNYREAINYAKKAKDRAMRLQRREMRL
ncbi:MAG: CARDB domain-containing protein, partial [Thermoplasmata archaeon]